MAYCITMEKIKEQLSLSPLFQTQWNYLALEDLYLDINTVIIYFEKLAYLFNSIYLFSIFPKA